MTKGIENPFKFHLIAIFSISLACIIIYSNTLNSPFVFDDYRNIRENKFIRLTNFEFQKLYDAGFKSISQTRPVANISFAFNYYFGRYDVTGYHIVNIIIHLVNGILVYFLSVILFKQTSDLPNQKKPQAGIPLILLMSLFAALIFINHPLQTQSVTYIVQRMNSLAVMFYLLSFLLYINARLARIRWKRCSLWSGCLVSWIMALGTKEIAVTFPLIILLYEWYFFQDLRSDWLLRNIKYILALLAVIFLFSFIYLGSSPFDSILNGYNSRYFTLLERVLTQFRVVVFYISLVLYPHPSRLNLLHHIPSSHSLFLPTTTLFSLLIIVGFLSLSIYLSKKQRLISFGILWFFIHLIIESSVIPLEMIYEHRLYLPLFGFAIILPYLLFSLFSKRRLLVYAVSVSIILSLGTGTYLRNRLWQDRVILWSDVVFKNKQKNIQSPRAHYNLALALLNKGRLEEAIVHFSEAIRLRPNYVEAHNNLGNALSDQGRIGEAITHYSEALRIAPRFAVAHRNLGNEFMRGGKTKEAIHHLSEAIRINPDYAEAHYDIGIVLMRQRKFEGAIHHLSEAIRIKPDYAKAHNNLGVAIASQGKLQEAIDHFSEALRINPQLVEAHNNLGVALMRKGQFKQATHYFSEAIRIKPNYKEAQKNLEVALKKIGKSQKN